MSDGIGYRKTDDDPLQTLAEAAGAEVLSDCIAHLHSDHTEVVIKMQHDFYKDARNIDIEFHDIPLPLAKKLCEVFRDWEGNDDNT